MTTYVATINTPGYLPMDDDPPTFDTTFDAWSYLREERIRAEDDVVESEDEPYTDTVENLRLAAVNNEIGTVYGPTPGYEGDHDLGLAYTVQEVEE
jgi:hypothetical protein